MTKRGEFESLTGVELGVGIATFYVGGVAVHSLNDHLIGNDYLRVTDKIDGVNQEISTLTPALATVKTDTDNQQALDVITQAIGKREFQVQTLKDERNHYHAPFGSLTEIAADGGLILLAVAATAGIRRHIHNRRKRKQKDIAPPEQPNVLVTNPL